MEKRLNVLAKQLKKYGNFWPDNYIPNSDRVLLPSKTLLDSYTKLLDDGCNENIIHKFIERNPLLLSYLMYGGKGNWVFSKPRFGCEYIPDFLICTQDSSGFHWTLVELESPNKKALRKNGQQTSEVSNAIKQINEWRFWIRKNISYARYELKYFDIDAECTALIIIGRRKYIAEELKEYYRELSNGSLKIMSYDRINYLK